MNTIFRIGFVLVFTCVFSISTVRANENSAISEVMTKVSVKIESSLKKLERPKKILLGEFKPLRSLKSSGGVELRRVFEECLREQGFEFSDEGVFTEVKGDYKLTKGKAQKRDKFDSVGIDITFTFYDEDGFELQIDEIEVEGQTQKVSKIGLPVFGDQSLSIAGVQFEVSPKDSEPVKQKKLLDQIKNPLTTLKGNQVRQTGPFGIEILVNRNGKYESRTPKLDKKKRAFVPLHDGEEYAVRIHNDGDFDIACRILIDGVNMFVTAKNEKHRNEQILVGAGKAGIIKGWFVHEGKDKSLGASTKAFLISGFEDSVTGRLGNTFNVGTISMQVRAAWDPEGDPPADEPKGTTRGSKGPATAEGRDLNIKYKRVPRTISDKVRSTINIRYAKETEE